jgi:hypothetical protein
MSMGGWPSGMSGAQPSARGRPTFPAFSESWTRSRRVEPSHLGDLLSDVRGLRWAVAGFAACRELGVLHAAFTTSEVYVEDTAKALAVWHLEPCDPRDAQLVLLRTPFAESAFRAPTTMGKLHVVDVLQAALDVSRHAARGLEQAEYIVHEVLCWKDVRLG